MLIEAGFVAIAEGAAEALLRRTARTPHAMPPTSRAGFEPTTSGSGGQRSVQLGYRDHASRHLAVYSPTGAGQVAFALWA